MNSLLQVVALLVVAIIAENATASFTYTYTSTTSHPDNVAFEISPPGQLGGSQAFDSPVVTTLTYVTSTSNPNSFQTLYVQVIIVDAVGRNITTSSVFAKGVNCTDLSNAIAPVVYPYKVKIKFPDGTSDQLTSEKTLLFSLFCPKLETDAEVCMIIQGSKIIAYSPVAPQCQDSDGICFAAYMVDAIRTCPLMQGRVVLFVTTAFQLVDVLGKDRKAFLTTVEANVPKYSFFG